MLETFTQAIPVIEKIEEAGFEAYFVGGSVRDYLLNKEIEDVDIASSATPEEIKGIFPKTVDVGIEHGTVLVLFKGQTYEITTFRSESGYEDFRRPKNVQFIRSLREDLQRRDFTMNAIAMDRTGKLIDPFSGYDDIKKKVIRTVGLAEERFSEDALRIMRAIRFVSKLSFKIEDETLSAIKKNGSLLLNISVERKTKEFEKLLCGKNRSQSIKILLETGLHSFLPGLNHQEERLKVLCDYTYDNLQLNEMWALLLFSLKIPSNQSVSFLKEWKLSNQKMKEIERILFFLQKRLLHKWNELTLFQSGKDICVSVERIFHMVNGGKSEEEIKYLKEKYESLPIKSLGELAVSGQDIMNWRNESGGPWLKELLEKIEHVVLLGIIPNEKEAIREWLFTCNPK
jgi:tRNA nucleotidyltransferase (CCA-adding enzyme)